MNIIIATVQVPFVRGGGEILAEGLRHAFIRQGFRADILSAPFRFSPHSAIRESADWWDKHDISRFCAGNVDRVVYLKFPCYFASHPNSALWLLHQHRAYYELWDQNKAGSAESVVRDKIVKEDTQKISAIRKKYTISNRVSERLSKYNGIASTPIYHPPHGEEHFYCGETLPYIFSPSRLEPLKRQILLIEAMALVKSPFFAVIAGEGGYREVLERRIQELCVQDRVRLVGRLSDTDMRAYYARSSAIFFGPFDEDYGYITLEAMLSSKPTITCSDSGGPLEFVKDGVTGRVVDPHPHEIAIAIENYAAAPHLARKHGEQARALYESLNISWDNVVNELISD